MFEQIHERSAILHQALDGLTARQRVTANNLANADTPGFTAKEVQFENLLKQKIQARSNQGVELVQTHPEHLPIHDLDHSRYTIQELQGQMRNDGNGVDLEQEVTRMTQAQMSYQAVSQQLAGSFASLKYVIAEGGR